MVELWAGIDAAWTGNFQYSPLIAEFFNTVSNIAFGELFERTKFGCWNWCSPLLALTELTSLRTVGLAMLGIHKVIQQRLPLRFAGAYFGMMIVGIGSALFHTTLQYSWQLTDELPMIVLATFVVFVLFDLSPGGERKRFWSKASAGAGFLVLFNAFFVYAYTTFPKYVPSPPHPFRRDSLIPLSILPSPLYHQLSFGTIQAISIFRGTYILYFAPSMLAPPHRFAQNLEARKLQSRGTLLFLLGFIAWNIDNLLCGVLTELKRRVGAPWNILLEFHAWWHLWTGLGVYAVVCGIEYITLCLRFNPG